MCDRCVHHATSSGSAVAVAVAFVFVTASGAWTAFNRDWLGLRDAPWYVWFALLVGTVAGAAFIGQDEPPKLGSRLRPRRSHARPTHATVRTAGHPYRTLARRASRAVASPVSGRATVAVLIGCMAVVAAALPRWLRLSPWIETEVVLGAWWLLWTVVLSTLLHRGWRLSDDHVLGPLHPPLPNLEGGSRARGGEGGCGELLLLPEFLIVVVLVGGFLLGVWLVVDLLVPAAVFGAYACVRAALAHVANDEHGCEGRLARAIAWGAAWSTAYLAPFALGVILLRLARGG